MGAKTNMTALPEFQPVLQPEQTEPPETSRTPLVLVGPVPIEIVQSKLENLPLDDQLTPEQRLKAAQFVVAHHVSTVEALRQKEPLVPAQHPLRTRAYFRALTQAETRQQHAQYRLRVAELAMSGVLAPDDYRPEVVNAEPDLHRLSCTEHLFRRAIAYRLKHALRPAMDKMVSHMQPRYLENLDSPTQA